MPAKVQNFQSRTSSQSPAPYGVDAQQWINNPYANFDYRHTWWQKLWEGLGFRSKFDEYRDSMALNANEYESQLLEKGHNEQYDSASAQAQRMRQAGINPDLQGGVDAGSSSGMEPDPNAPISPGYNDPSGVLEGFANTVLSCFTGAIGLAKDSLSLLQMKNDVDSGKLGNSQSIFDFALSAARNFIPEQYPEGDPSWVNRAVDLAFDSTSLFMSKKQQKMFRRALSSFYSSAPTQAEQWKAWRENMSQKQGWFIESGSEFWSDQDEVLRVITDNLSKYNDRILKASKQASARTAENESAYQGSLDSSLGAQVENATNERNLHAANIDYILNECLDSIISDLRDTSESGKRGHGLAQAALLLFSVLRMVNFSKSSTSGMTPFGRVDTTTQNFGF